jgi:eukaryotic-like serine/threonine-protein kinase
MDFCPNCGALIPEGSLRCEACQADFAAEDQPGRAEGTSPAPSSTSLSLDAGSVVANRYEIVARLGSGGVGAVFKARDRHLGPDVAPKINNPESFERKDAAKRFSALSRFKAEVVNARQVNHPNVCRIYDISSWEGYLFVTMDLLEGRDLLEILRSRGPLRWEEALPILDDVLKALSAVHGAGIIHMDLKPANIFITPDGHAFLMDFGISRPAADSPHGEAGGRPAAGTPEYMAPELCEGKSADERSDIYSLGCVLFEMLTWRLPFSGNNPAAIMRGKMEGRPDFGGGLWQSLQPWQKGLVERCLRREPGERFGSAVEFRRALHAGEGLALAEGSEVHPVLLPSVVAAPQLSRRMVRALLLVAGAISLLAIALLLFTR